MSSGPSTEDPAMPDEGAIARTEPIGVPADIPSELQALAAVLSAWRALGTSTGSPRYELSRRCPELHRALVDLDGAYR